MMYQSVGSEGVELQAKALGIPLYTSLTHGRTKQTSMEYEREEGDEVEDLMELLTKIKVFIIACNLFYLFQCLLKVRSMY